MLAAIENNKDVNGVKERTDELVIEFEASHKSGLKFPVRAACLPKEIVFHSTLGGEDLNEAIFEFGLECVVHRQLNDYNMESMASVSLVIEEDEAYYVLTRVCPFPGDISVPSEKAIALADFMVLDAMISFASTIGPLAGELRSELNEQVAFMQENDFVGVCCVDDGDAECDGDCDNCAEREACVAECGCDGNCAECDDPCDE